MLPRLRLLVVGGFCLLIDLGVFTAGIGCGLDPLRARLVSLACATLVNWRVNRALTERSGRHQGEEGMRYSAVTATRYVVFAALLLTVFDKPPEAGAPVGAVVGYDAYGLFTFKRGVVASLVTCLIETRA
jgi:putative flippase GtrA